MLTKVGNLPFDQISVFNFTFFQVFCVVAFLAASALARPQSDLDDFNEELNRLGPINPNPQYTYSYQVADDKEQTYLAHNENRDGDQVTGQYSYVDANGALVTVVYTAGVDGYQEERTVQEGFIEVRARPAPTAAPKPVTRAPAPAPTPAPRPVRPAAPVQNNDDDLVARIIAQLTPFIRDTVSNSLSSQASAPAPQPAPAAPRRVAVAAPAPVPAASGVEGVFGVGGANNVRVESPDFKFAYDF